MITYRPSLAGKFRCTPEFEEEVLVGTPKLGIQFVLELQDRSRPNDFYVAGRTSQFLDPRTLQGPVLDAGDGSSLSDRMLRSADDELVQAPEGCSFLHEWVVLLEAKNTDPYGFQYRSDMFSDAPTGDSAVASSSASDEVWTPSPSHRCTTRRRVWFRSFCASSGVKVAKMKLSNEIIARCRGGESLRGEMWKLGYINRTWKKRNFILTDKSMDYYSGPPSVINKQGSWDLSAGCTVRTLYGQQCPGRSFAIMIQSPDGKARNLLLDAYSDHERVDWVFHLSYVLAMLNPSMNFPPLPSSPPFQVRPDDKVIFRGDLVKQGHVVTNWTTRHFELTSQVLRYYDGINVKGTVPLLDATLTDLADGASSSRSPAGAGSNKQESSLEFSLSSRSGYLLRMRAPSKTSKDEWLENVAVAIAQAGASYSLGVMDSSSRGRGTSSASSSGGLGGGGVGASGAQRPEPVGVSGSESVEQRQQSVARDTPSMASSSQGSASSNANTIKKKGGSTALLSMLLVPLVFAVLAFFYGRIVSSKSFQ